MTQLVINLTHLLTTRDKEMKIKVKQSKSKSRSFLLFLSECEEKKDLLGYFILIKYTQVHVTNSLWTKEKDMKYIQLNVSKQILKQKINMNSSFRRQIENQYELKFYQTNRESVWTQVLQDNNKKLVLTWTKQCKITWKKIQSYSK